MQRQFLTALTGLYLACPLAAVAQTPAPRPPGQPTVVMVSSNKCALDAPPKLDSLAAIAFYPILDELVKENRLTGWGVLTHAWGDEWNYIIYYNATSTAAFYTAWDELVRRLRQRRPGFVSDLAPYCTEHKDNMYGIMRTNAPVTTPPR